MGLTGRWGVLRPSHPEAVVRRASGGSSTLRAIDSIIGPSGIPDTPSRSRGAMRPRFAFSFTLPEKEGRRESRAPIAPAVVHKKRTSGPQVNRIIRLSLRDGLRLIRDLPGDRAFLPPSPCEYQMCRKPGWAGCISARLDASVGAPGPHDFAVRARLAKALAGPRTYPASFVETVSSAVRPRAGRSLTGKDPPCDPSRARRWRWVTAYT